MLMFSLYMDFSFVLTLHGAVVSTVYVTNINTSLNEYDVLSSGDDSENEPLFNFTLKYKIAIKQI